MWWGTAMESPDPAALAPVVATVRRLVGQIAEDYVRPVWPPGPGQQRAMMHLDVQVDDLDAATADAESLGAELAEIQFQANVRVMFDPDGHPFCLCRETG